MMPGWMALKRTGASSTASVRIKLLTAPLTVVIEVEPGYGRSLARPPNSTADAPAPMRGNSVCATSV